MSNLSKAIEAIGRDIGEIKGKQSSSLTINQAYGLFPTYNNFFLQVLEQNKFAEDPLVTKSQLPTSEIDALKQKVEELEKTILEIKQSIQK
jgi:transcription initiation factor IIF auxiliary subunit